MATESPQRSVPDLLASSALIQNLFYDVPDAIIIGNHDRDVVMVNPAFETMFGYSSEEVLGQKTSLLYESEEEFERIGPLRFKLQEAGSPAQYLTSYRRKNGETFPAEAVAATIRSEEGMVGYIAFIRDITERVALEKRADEARARLQDAIEVLDEGFALFDAEDRLVICNQPYRDLYQVSEDAIQIGRCFEDIMRDAVALGQFSMGGEGQNAWIERRLHNHLNPPDEPVLQELSDGRWIRHAERRTREGGIVGTRVDVSEQKWMEEALSKIYEITTSRQLDHDQKVTRILEFGCKQMRLPIGMVSRVEGQRLRILTAVSPAGEVEVGQTFELEGTYCAICLAAEKPVGLHDVASLDSTANPVQAMTQSYLGTPLHVDGEVFGTLCFLGPEAGKRPYVAGEYKLVALFAEFVGHEIARQKDLEILQATQKHLERLATTDDLTGANNRRQFFSLGSQEFRHAQRYRRAMTAMMVDIDHFKAVNDRHGHDVGDKVLQAVVETCKTHLREVDVFGRLGGEEFAVILPETNQNGALLVAERLRSAVAALQIPLDDGALSVTICLGVAELASDDDLQALLRRADQGLYKAKTQGRDQAVAA